MYRNHRVVTFEYFSITGKVDTSSGESIDDLLANINSHVMKEHKYIPETAIYATNVSEAMQCYTDFEPRAEPKTDIGARIVPNGHGWKRAIFEEFLDINILTKARSRGYLDFKYM